jgi:hypothetical protein
MNQFPPSPCFKILLKIRWDIHSSRWKTPVANRKNLQSEIFKYFVWTCLLTFFNALWIDIARRNRTSEKRKYQCLKPWREKNYIVPKNSADYTFVVRLYKEWYYLVKNKEGKHLRTATCKCSFIYSADPAGALYISNTIHHTIDIFHNLFFTLYRNPFSVEF